MPKIKAKIVNENQEKVGILIFYLNIERIAPADVDGLLEMTIEAFQPPNPESPLNKWEPLVVPIRNRETHCQVIRTNDVNDPSISIEIEQLQNFINAKVKELEK